MQLVCVTGKNFPVSLYIITIYMYIYAKPTIHVNDLINDLGLVR